MSSWIQSIVTVALLTGLSGAANAASSRVVEIYQPAPVAQSYQRSGGQVEYRLSNLASYRVSDARVAAYKEMHNICVGTFTITQEWNQMGSGRLSSPGSGPEVVFHEMTFQCDNAPSAPGSVANVGTPSTK